jgi:isopentenyl diphosphate isomerase/L-lactate dehydrogenase-like FMN-dependent dehydrogenase
VAHFADFQNDIYLRGRLTDEVPALTTDLLALEAAARQTLGRGSFTYVAGAAGGGATARANREALERRRIVPRMLRDVAERDLSVTLFGATLPAPVLLAPVGVQSIVHPDGELATARAASGLGLPMVVSTVSSYPLEEVAAAGGEGPRWFQLYCPKDRDVAAALLGRARKAGYSALVVTVDTFMMGWRPGDLDRAYLPFLRLEGLADYLTEPAFLAGIAPEQRADDFARVAHWAGMFGDPTLTWDDLAFVREHWDGPVVLKGIQHPDDARRARDAGMDGVVVSNHGGRQVDGATASLDALPGVVEAVGADLTVLFDSGVRTGADVVKALALGARAVLLGRPYMYGLGLGGQAGVEHVLKCLLAEFDLTVALSGGRTLADLTPALLAPHVRD